MKITSRFNLEQITTGDFRLIETGTLICHKDELIFHFKGFIIKMAFLTDATIQSRIFEWSDTFPPTLKCYNFDNSISCSTIKPFELAKYPEQQTSTGQSQHEEVLYIAFSIIATDKTKVINYNFYTKNRI